MLRLIDNKKALLTIGKYFSHLSAMGYVRGKYVRKLVAYMFLIDMIEYMSVYISEKDYKDIEKMLSCIFTNGGCLLSYPVFYARRTELMNTPAVLGERNIFGSVWHRVTTNEGVSVRGTEHDESILETTND